MFRRRKHGIAEAARDVPVGLFCFELLYADGEDLTMLPYPERRARLAEAVTLSDRLRLTTALEVSTAAALDAMFDAGRGRRRRGPGVQGDGRRTPLPGRRRAAGGGSSSSATTAPSWPTPSTWWSSAHMRGAGGGRARMGRCCWPRTTPTRSSTGRSAGAGPASPTPTWPHCPNGWRRDCGPERPARVDSRVPADVWFEPAW